jgi:HEAT repeat protein
MPKLTRSEQLRAKYRKAAARAKGREERLDRERIDDLLRQTTEADADARCAAVQALCPCHVQSNIAPVWDRLLALVHDPDVRVRSLVLHTLCDGSPREREPEVVAALEAMHNDPDQKLRRRVRQVLAQYRRTGRVNIL